MLGECVIDGTIGHYHLAIRTAYYIYRHLPVERTLKPDIHMIRGRGTHTPRQREYLDLEVFFSVAEGSDCNGG